MRKTNVRKAAICVATMALVGLTACSSDKADDMAVNSATTAAVETVVDANAETETMVAVENVTLSAEEEKAMFESMNDADTDMEVSDEATPDELKEDAEIEIDSDEEEAAPIATIEHTGVVDSIEEVDGDRFILVKNDDLGEIAFVITKDSEAKVTEKLAVGAEVVVGFDGITTRSLPPQAPGVQWIRTVEEHETALEALDNTEDNASEVVVDSSIVDEANLEATEEGPEEAKEVEVEE